MLRRTPPGNLAATDDALRAEWAETRQLLQGAHELLCSMDARLDEIARLQRRKLPDRAVVSIGGGGSPATGMPFILHTKGYRHSRLWVPAAVSVILDMGYGQAATLALVAGWNALDASDNAVLTATTGTTINAILELTDDAVR